MNFNEILNAYLELKEILEKKKQAIVNKNLETINKADENTVVLCEKIAKFNLKNAPNDFSEAQKEQLRTLGKEIRDLQKNNEILIKHSLDVINDLLSGILNIARNENRSYDSKGLGKCDNDGLDISSITEEA